MTFDLVVPSRLDAPGLQESIRRRADSNEYRATIDLRAARFVTPAGLVGVASFAESVVENGGSVHLYPPSDPSVGRYLSRMHLGVVLDELGISHRLPSHSTELSSDALIELRSFGGDEIDDLGKLVHGAAEGRGASADAAGQLFRGLIEASQNVPQHSGRSGGYVAAQKTHKKPELRFAVADSGMGFLNALSGRGASTSREALEMALNGTSDTGDALRGKGLTTMATNLTALGGELHLVSGNCRITVKVVQTTSRRVPKTASGWMPGAVVEGVLPL